MSRSILIFSIILLAFTLGACNEEPRADLRKAVKDAFKQDDIAFEAMSYKYYHYRDRLIYQLPWRDRMKL